MGETAREDGGLTGGAGKVPTDVPLAEFTFRIAGRSWRILAARDHAALMAAADRFVAFPFGLLLWESAQALAEALADDKESVAGRSVLELGAGVGLPGIIARALGASAVRQTDHISEALALCRANAEKNGIDGIELALANWDAWTDAGSYDLIIGSDVVYERAAHAPLAAILDRNLAAGGRVLLADPGRQDTPLFLADLAAAGWKSARHRRTLAALLQGGAETVDIDIIELWK
jgi:predicted nicotinamide N-methyase